MQVTQKNVDATFQFIGLKQSRIKEVLDQYKNYPNYSEYIAEFVYFYVAPKGSTIRKVYVKNGKHKHYLWFIQWPDGTVIDLTLQANQEMPEYEKSISGKLKNKIGPQMISKQIAEKLGYTDDDIDLEDEN